MTTPADSYPVNWLSPEPFEPQKHLIQLKGRDYMNVQQRLVWFVADQRNLIASGLAKMAYILQTDLIEHDRQNGWAQFKTYIRDVLGNEAIMYGSESVRDFADYAEKASTKSLGRALLLLGYGTPFATELDEGERVVDAPQEPRQSQPALQETRKNLEQQTKGTTWEASHKNQPPARPTPSRQPQSHPVPTSANTTETMATDRQLTAIRKLCTALNRAEPDLKDMTFNAARELLTQLSNAYSGSRQAS